MKRNYDELSYYFHSKSLLLFPALKPYIIYQCPNSPEGKMNGKWQRFSQRNQLIDIFQCDFPSYKWSRLTEDLEAWLLYSTNKPKWMHNGKFYKLIAIPFGVS